MLLAPITNVYIQRQWNQIQKDSSTLVQSMARQILRENPELDEFIMGMGRWFFTIKIGTQFVDEKNGYPADDPYIVTKANNYLENHPPTKELYQKIKPIRDFIQEWDEQLRISGEPMRFTATGPKITSWGCKKI